MARFLMSFAGARRDEIEQSLRGALTVYQAQKNKSLRNFVVNSSEEGAYGDSQLVAGVVILVERGKMTEKEALGALAQNLSSLNGIRQDPKEVWELGKKVLGELKARSQRAAEAVQGMAGQTEVTEKVGEVVEEEA